MTPLSLTRPLAGILDACREAGRPLSQRDLGERRSPPVTQPTVANALAVGDGIALSNLAAYADAAGWRLLVGVNVPSAGSSLGQRRKWAVTGGGRGSGVGVGPLRDALAGLGMEMTLTVEEM